MEATSVETVPTGRGGNTNRGRVAFSCLIFRDRESVEIRRSLSRIVPDRVEASESAREQNMLAKLDLPEGAL